MRSTKQNSKPDIGKIMRNDREVTSALRKAAREAVGNAALAGASVPVWEKGCVVWIDPHSALRKPLRIRRPA
jgi:hypothetical protein